MSLAQISSDKGLLTCLELANYTRVQDAGAVRNKKNYTDIATIKVRFLTTDARDALRPPRLT